MRQHETSGLKVAEWLEHQVGGEGVTHPLLPKHPQVSVIVLLMASVVVIVNVIVTNTFNIFITAHFGSSPAPWETFWNVGVQVLRKSLNLHVQAQRHDMLIALI